MESVLGLFKKFDGIFSGRSRVFQIVSYKLNYISNDPPTHGGVYFDHLEQFAISFMTLEKLPGNVPRNFRVFQIVSYQLNHISKIP